MRPLFWNVMEDNELKVRISGLSAGEHDFQFKVGQAFFSSFESELLENGEVGIDLLMVKKATHLELNFKLEGWVSSVCDRCLVDYQHPINSENRLFVKFGDDFKELSDEMVMIPRENHEVDAGQWVYEFILMSIPMKKVACEILDDDSICDENVKALTAEGQTEQRNPIWDALKDLNNDNLN